MGFHQVGDDFYVFWDVARLNGFNMYFNYEYSSEVRPGVFKFKMSPSTSVATFPYSCNDGFMYSTTRTITMYSGHTSSYITSITAADWYNKDLTNTLRANSGYFTDVALKGDFASGTHAQDQLLNNPFHYSMDSNNYGSDEELNCKALPYYKDILPDTTVIASSDSTTIDV